MTTQSILKQRVSSRDFSNQKVAIDDIKAIIAEAQLAPSWENSQPWKAYVATGKTLEAIKKWHFDNVTNGGKSWVDIMPPQEWHIHAKDNIAAWEKATQNDLGEKGWQDFWSAQSHFFNAPAVVYITIPKDSTHYSAYDAGAFGYGILLAAAERGLASLPAYEFIRFPKEIRKQLEIPEEESLLMRIALGYASDKPLNDLRTTRNPLDDILKISD